MLHGRRIEVPDPEMVSLLRLMTPAQRLAQAHEMWRFARARVDAAVRAHYPHWPEPRIRSEIQRRMLGPG